MANSDNFRPEPERPTGVTDDLERALRDCLSGAAGKAGDAYPIRNDDRVGTAIRRGRRVQRRRSAVGTALVAAATALAAVGVTQAVAAPHRYAGPAWIGDPTPEIERVDPAPLSPSPELPELAVGQRPAVDVVVSGGLRTASGKVVDLAALGQVTQVHEAEGGWLVVGGQTEDGLALWYVDQNGGQRKVLPQAKAMVLGPDGERVAWVDGARLFSARVVKGQVAAAKQVTAPPQGMPVSFVGSAVLMARSHDGTLDAYAVWWPDRGAFQPSWNESAVTIYGPMPDGTTVVGQVAQQPDHAACLALLDASKALSVVKTACATRLAEHGAGTVSPDGRWLVADAATTDLALLIDLGSAFTTKPAPAREAGPPITGGAVWTDAGTVVHEAAQGLVRVRVDRLAAGKAGVEDVAVPGVAPDSILILVRKRLA